MKFIKLSKLPLLSLTLSFWILSAQAAAIPPSDITSEESFFQDLPVVLTASRLSQPLSEAPSATTVIDSEMIKASGFRTVPELMQLVPGMYVGYVDGNTPVLSLHNSTDQYSRQMQVLIDGRSVYMPPLGGVNWASLPLLIDDIERIEVVRGPSSASHGSNSFYGVINIITRDVSTENGSGRLSLTGGYASDASAKLSRIGEEFDYRISAGYRSDGGYSNSYLNDHNQTRIANFSGNYHPNASDSFSVEFGSSNGVYGTGIFQTTGVNAGIIRTDNLFRDTTANSDFQLLSWLHTWSTSDESKLTYSHTEDRTFDPLLCITPFGPGCVVVNGSLSGTTQYSVYGQRDVLEMQNTNQLGDNNRLVWGANSEYAYASDPLLLQSSPKLKSWSIFAHDEWRISPKAIFNMGTMFEDNGMGYQSNSPRASLNYHLTPQHTLRFGMSTATRNPAMMEANINASTPIFGGAYAPTVTPISPEEIFSREIGYIGEFPSLGMTLDTRAYIDQVSEMIMVDKCVDGVLCNQDSWKNMGNSEFKGVDATLKLFWNDKHSSLTANYAYQRATMSLGSLPTQYLSSFNTPYFTVLGADVQSFYQTQILNLFPQSVDTNSGSLLLSQRIAESWQFSAGYYFRAPVRVLDVSTDVPPESRMRRLDLRLAKTFKLEQGRSVEVAAIVQNATQDVYTKYDTLGAETNVTFTRRSWVTGTFNF
jgi:iron complex outermembrane receptor protein